MKQGQLKIKNINGKIVAKPDLKTAPGNGVVRKYKVAEKGIRYRKIYKTKESRYIYFMSDMAEFASEKNKIDKTDAALTGISAGVGGGLGAGFLIGEYLARKKSGAAKIKYGVTGAAIGTVGLGSSAAYQNIRNQKKKGGNI